MDSSLVVGGCNQRGCWALRVDLGRPMPHFALTTTKEHGIISLNFFFSGVGHTVPPVDGFDGKSAYIKRAFGGPEEWAGPTNWQVQGRVQDSRLHCICFKCCT